MSMIDKMNQRIADNAFDTFAAGDCLIESDGRGPELWNAARKAATAGLAAFTLFTAVAPGYASEASIQMPTEQVSSTYLQHVDEALADGGLDWAGNGFTGVRTVDKPWVGEFLAEHERNTTPLFGNIEMAVPYSGATCVISYAKDASSHRNSLDLPDGFEIGRYEEMRALSYCAVWGLLSGKSFGQHADTVSGAIPLADVMTALATAKYDTQAFESVYAMQGALALSALRSGNAHEKAVALWKLEALGKVHDYVHSPDGPRKISSASIEDLVHVSDMLARASQHSLKESRLVPTQVPSSSAPELQAALAEAGMTDAGRAAADAEESGLSREDSYSSAVRAKGCDDIERARVRREATARTLCKLFDEQKWEAGGGRGFEGDFRDFANSLLAPGEPRQAANP